jgi:tRNA pseudouridine38-40 synthase
MKKIALAIQYDGANYHGWQYQNENTATVQGELEKALKKIAGGQTVKLFCAGRTDAGVHASAQIAHFESELERETKAWVEGVNTLLPQDIAVQWGEFVSAEFHARFSASSRRYRYFIANTPQRPALASTRLTWFKFPLNEHAMHKAGQFLLGENNFQAFRGSGCQSNTPFRHVSEISVTRYGDFIEIDIEANAFLLHMVRNIVGVLLEVGQGIKPVEWTQEVLASENRTKAGMTARPNGLHLIKVQYPEQFGIPYFPSPHMSSL